MEARVVQKLIKVEKDLGEIQSSLPDLIRAFDVLRETIRRAFRSMADGIIQAFEEGFSKLEQRVMDHRREAFRKFLQKIRDYRTTCTGKRFISSVNA